MKTRRHHNNQGRRQVRCGKSARDVRRIARKLGLACAVNDAAAESGMIGAVNEIELHDGWIKLSPYGDLLNDGGIEGPVSSGVQIFDRAAANEMVREFGGLRAKMANSFRGAPLYVGHPDAEGGEVDPRYGKAAVGWIKELEARADGLYGKPKWSKAGNEIVEEGYFQFLSPYWGMRPIAGRKNAFQPVVLFSAGLTNNPNIPGLAVGRNDQTKNHTMKKRAELIATLGLKDDATDDQIITALNELKKAKDDADAAVAKAANEKQQLEADIAAEKKLVTAANGKVASAEEATKAACKQRDELVLTGAVNEGRITEAQRPEWAGKLVGDFAAESKALGGLKKAINTEARTKALGGRKAEVEVPADRIAAINTAVTKYARENGLDPQKDRTVAWNAVKAGQPGLFADVAAD